jgi:hypothetical protein
MGEPLDTGMNNLTPERTLKTVAYYQGREGIGKLHQVQLNVSLLLTFRFWMEFRLPL